MKKMKADPYYNALQVKYEMCIRDSPKVSAGKYVLKVSYIGFKSQYIPLHLYATTTAKNVGTLTLETDAVLLAEAVVTAEAPQVQVVEEIGRAHV